MYENNGKAKENPEHEINRRQETLKGMRSVYILLLFVILYTIVLLVYAAAPTIFWGSDILAFLTSPFNFKENFSNVYSSVVQGYWYNVGFTFAMMLASIIYSNLLAESKLIKPELVFWTSVIASYLVSIFVWLFAGAPSTGTSIIGFCIVAFLCGSTLYDLPVCFKKLKSQPQISTLVRFCAIAAILLLSYLVAVSFYWLGNNAYAYHFAGGAVAGILILAMVKRRQGIG